LRSGKVKGRDPDLILWPKAGTRTIIKIQLSVFSSNKDAERMMLLYDRRRSFQYETKAFPEVVAQMERNPTTALKAFFQAKWMPNKDPDQDGGPDRYTIVIGDMITDQGW
jgi:hypothetical protein